MNLYATLAGANPRQDVAILEGDFRAFAKLAIETDPNAIEASFTQSKRIVACGYPAGGKLNCNQVTSSYFFQFFYRGKAHLYPGQSGGPVFDMETGKIIAVNTAVHEDSVILAPLAELFAQLDLSEAS
jgi:S1-C subfamily serine protease